MSFRSIFKNSLFYLVFIALSLSTVSAQISPPGLGDAKTASWFALGARQDLDSAKNWQSMSYIGLGTKSNPTNTNPTFKPAILVLNQEFYHPFGKGWQTSFALSYRRQNEYAEEAPYSATEPSIQQEFRLYGRLSKSFSFNGLSLSPTLRQEIRRFYTPAFENTSEPLQLRSRFRIQLSTYVDSQKKHKLMLSSEQLFSTSKADNRATWSAFDYKESRFMFYYSYSPKSLPATFDIGYMNNLIGKHTPATVHYIALDIILKNPFGLK